MYFASMFLGTKVCDNAMGKRGQRGREAGGFSNTGRMHSKLLLRLDFIGE